MFPRKIPQFRSVVLQTHYWNQALFQARIRQYLITQAW